MNPLFLNDTHFQNLVTHLIRLKRGGTTGGPAHHKPVFLLALMDVLEESRATRPSFIPVDEVIYDRFREIWHKLVPGMPAGDFFQPVFYLPKEGFWSVFTRSGRLPGKKYGTLKGAAKDGLWGRFNEEYVKLLAMPEVRAIVRMILLDTYFPTTKKQYLSEYGQPELMAENDLTAVGMEEPAPQYLRQTRIIQFDGFVRHWKFRENVLHLYDHTCCISGLRAEKDNWHALVDACHIQEHAQSGINHPGNGLALCKNLHAAFDSGLISLTDEYRVLVSKDLRESDTGYSLQRLKGIEIRLPVQNKYHPDISYIRLHRERWGF